MQKDDLNREAGLSLGLTPLQKDWPCDGEDVRCAGVYSLSLLYHLNDWSIEERTFGALLRNSAANHFPLGWHRVDLLYYFQLLLSSVQIADYFKSYFKSNECQRIPRCVVLPQG